MCTFALALLGAALHKAEKLSAMLSSIELPVEGGAAATGGLSFYLPHLLSPPGQAPPTG